ncbi:MAG: hypothetical protein J7L21_02855 [Sulfurimonas sp.]|nr:hypothetical protein [Sulfurimonas sp.]
MAMFKEEEITAKLISEKFPEVASELTTNAKSNQLEVTAEMLNNDYPEIVASFVAQGEKAGIEKGVSAEAERIASIEAISAVGYEKVIADAKIDPKATADSTKLKLFDAMQAKNTATKKAIADDGKSLADLGAEIGAQEVEEPSGEDEAVSMMANASKSVRGE